MIKSQRAQRKNDAIPPICHFDYAHRAVSPLTERNRSEQPQKILCNLFG